ncbi:MAG: HAD family hydrolase [Rickettsiales bacterium]
MKFHKRPSAVIFDFDDTLVNTRPIINKALDSTFAKFNIDRKIIQDRDIDVNRSMRDYFHQIFADNIVEARDTYYSYYDEFSKDLEKFENAEAVLNLLKQHNLFTAIVSNKSGSRLRDEIQNKFMWNNFFDAVVGSGDAPEDKPSILPAKFALTAASLEDYEDVWFIGDSLVDLKTAKNLGAKGILFGSNGIDNYKVPIYTSVNNHGELLELLENILKVKGDY